MIGRLHSNRPFNSQALIRTMRLVCKPAKTLIVDTIHDNCFLFKFTARGDIDHVLEGRPWFFERHVLLLEEVRLSAPLQNIVLETTPFWIRLYDLPIAAWCESIVRKLASCVREVCQVCYSEAGGIVGRYARVQVDLSIRKPLVRGVPYKGVGQEPIVITFKYERLQHFSYRCRFLGHVDRDYEQEETKNLPLQYGPFMSASSAKGRFNRMNGGNNAPNSDRKGPSHDE